MIRPLFFLLAAGLITACAGVPASQEAPESKAAPSALSGLPDGGLPPQRLAAGECGLFLWEKSAPRRFVFFMKADAAEALVLLNGAPVPLAVTAAGGTVFGQFLTEMRFAREAPDLNFNVSITPGDVIEGGQRVDSGYILTRTAEGWETVTPITGVRACMPG